jgi:hypothetical protein
MLGVVRTVATLVVVVLLSACGTTLSSRSQSSLGGSGASGVSGGQVATPGGGVTSSASSSSSPSSTPTPGALGVSSSSPAAAALNSPTPPTAGAAVPVVTQGAAGPVSIPVTGPGWDAKHVYIGVTTQKDSQAVFGSLGYKGVEPGDTQAQAQTMANQINSRGGILGRQVTLVFHDESTIATAENPDAAAQVACTAFTQDHRVIAVINIVTEMDGSTWRSCLAHAHVALFSASLAAVDDHEAQSLAPDFYQLDAVTWNVLAPVLVSQLQAEGWFGGWNTHTHAPGPLPAKVGILVDSTPVGTRIGTIIDQALTAAGHPGAVTFQYNLPGNNIQPAVLYFAGHGVTHIISSDIELFAFQNSATGNQYYPRFALTTYNAPYNNLELHSPANANDGAMGLGWAPYLDVSDANDPGAVSSGRQQCLATMAAGGQHFSGERLAGAFASAICDAFRLIALGAPGNGFAAGPLYQGIMRAAPGLSASIGFGNALSPAKLFVPGAARTLSYSQGCSCMRYGTGEAPL